MISPALCAILDACVQLMANNEEDRTLDLFPHRTELRTAQADCIAYLADGVERATDGKRSVREVHYSALADAPMGIDNLFVAVCAASVRAQTVSVLSNAMTGYIISPGGGIGCAISPPA